MSDKKGELVPQQSSREIANHMPDPLDIFSGDRSNDQFWTTLPITTERGRYIVQAALMDDVPGMDVYINKEFECEHVLVHPFQIEKDGELIQGLRVVLIGPEPKRCMLNWFGTSGTRSIRRIAQIFGPPPWNPPLPLNIGQMQINGERRIHTLKVKEGYQPKTTKAGK